MLTQGCKAISFKVFLNLGFPILLAYFLFIQIILSRYLFLKLDRCVCEWADSDIMLNQIHNVPKHNVWDSRVYMSVLLNSRMRILLGIQNSPPFLYLLAAWSSPMRPSHWHTKQHFQIITAARSCLCAGKRKLEIRVNIFPFFLIYFSTW